MAHGSRFPSVAKETMACDPTKLLLAVRHSDSLIGTQGHHHVHEAAMSVSEPVRSGMEHSSRRTVRGYEIELGALASI
jgi:hypothetical protein